MKWKGELSSIAHHHKVRDDTINETQCGFTLNTKQLLT